MAFPLLAILPFVDKIVDKLFPDPSAAAEARIKLLQLQQSGELAVLAAETDLLKGQLEINKVEAGSEDKFTSRWRPAMGWVCVLAFAYKFVLQPLLIFLLVASGSGFDHKLLPVLDWAEMGPVLLGLLGLGTMRSIEKVKGTN